MKSKFEANVASELPKTRMSQEPGLPWKVDSADLAEVKSIEDEFKSATTGIPPLKARAPFLAALLIAVFITTVYYISASVLESEKARQAAQQKEAAVSSIRTDLERISGEKKMLSDAKQQLEKQVRDLSSQKELFTTVIESLSKKSDEPSAESGK